MRAPEVVLNDLVSLMVTALPQDLDLSEVLATKLTRPLLSNVKSSNVAVRDGVLRTFATIARRCKEEKHVTTIANEILTPLKTNKVTAAEQKTIHAQMLALLPASPTIRDTVPEGLAPLLTKEANEGAASAEISAIVHYGSASLADDKPLSKAVVDAFNKGIAEKRLPIRRLWVQHFCNLIWTLPEEALQNDAVKALVDACIGKLLAVFEEVYTNPTPAVQSNQIGAAAGIAALLIGHASSIPSIQSSAEVKKAKLGERIFLLEPKPSFLLSPRIYTKLATEEDLTSFIRALTAVFPQAAKQSIEVQQAWAQAALFVLCTSGLPNKAQALLAANITQLYKREPTSTARAVIDGIWRWCEDLELGVKESAAVISKSERQGLYKVVKCICQKSDTTDNLATRQQQMAHLLVLCQPALLPRVSWIEQCLQMSVDPGALATERAEDILDMVLSITEHPVRKTLQPFQAAAYSAAAELAFVAPDAITPLLLSCITNDLNAKQLDQIGPTEAAIYRTPSDVTFIDVLGKQSAPVVVDKNTKDYDTLKWEAELRAQLAAKKGASKKLTAEEQSKVNSQLAKEADIRKKSRPSIPSCDEASASSTPSSKVHPQRLRHGSDLLFKHYSKSSKEALGYCSATLLLWRTSSARIASQHVSGQMVLSLAWPHFVLQDLQYFQKISSLSH